MLKKILIGLFLYSIGQTAHSQRIQVDLVDEKIIIFDETEPEELYVEGKTSHFEKGYLNEFYKYEIAPDLVELGYSKKRIIATLSRVLRIFNDVGEDENIYYNRYSNRNESGYINLQVDFD